MIRAVLFDLDGTFADTAPDLCYAVNLMREARGLAPVALEATRPVTSLGARGLLGAGFNITPDDPGYLSLREEFLQLYEQNLCLHTRLFPGISELIDALESRGLRWGIVTNKPRFLTEALLDRLGIANAPHCVVSGDDLPLRKPDPAPLQHAARSIGVPPSACLYIGDAKGDIVAGRAAGMRTVAAAYGYIRPDEDIASWQADAVLMRPTDLAQLLARLWA